MNTHCALTLPPCQLGFLVYLSQGHRVGCPGEHNSKHLSRTQGSEKATARVGLSMSSSIPTTGTKSPCLSWHLDVALPPEGQVCLTCPTPSALASSPAAGPPKPTSFLFHLWQKRKRYSPVQSHAQAHNLFLGGKHKERQQEIDRKKCKAWVCHTLLHLFPGPPFYQFEGKKGFGMKKHKAEEGCRKRLVMHSLCPLDSLVQERQQDSLPTVCGLQQPTDIRL